MEGYHTYLVGLGLHQKTIRNYVQAVERAAPFFVARHTSLHWASPEQIAEYVETTPKSASTRRVIAVAFGHYWEWKERQNPPLKAIRIPPVPEMVCRALEPDEARDLIKVSLGWWPKGTAVLMGMYLALRCSEIAQAEWERFSPDMDWYRVTGKRDKTATLPVHPILKAELQELRGTGWVFKGRFPSRPVASATIWQWSKEVAAEVGIHDFTTHQLRHTSLATANDNTGNLRSVQTFARHSKPSSTVGYTRTTKTRLREVSDSLDYL